MNAIIGAMRQVAANPSLRRVAAGWLASIAAEWTFVVALLVIAHEFGGVVGVAVVTTARMLPAALLAPALAALADRHPRARVLVGVHAARAVCIGLAAAAQAAGVPALIVAAAVAEGIVAALNRPTTLALQPELSRSPGELIAANAVTSSGEAIGVLVGPALGGVLMALSGATLAMAVGASGFVVAALAVRPLSAPAAARPASVSGPADRSAAAYTDLLRYPAAGLVLALFTAQTLVRGAFTVLLVAASVELLGLGRSGLGFLTAAQGAGAVAGAVLAFGLVGGRRLAVTFSICLALWGLPIALIGAVPAVAFAFGGLAVIGAANALLDVAGFTLMLRSVPNVLRGRLFGVLEALVGLSVTLGSLAAPLLVVILGLPTALVAVGLLLPTLALLTSVWVARTQAATAVPDRELALVRGISLFAPLSLAAQERLAAAMQPQGVAAGEAIVVEGEPGEAYFIIAAGRVEVTRGGVRLRELGPGEAFGETALLRDVPRTATVRAIEPAELRRLDRVDFLDAVLGTPASASEAHHVAEAHLAH